MLLQVPNGFGCGLGATQLVLYIIYRDKKGKAKQGPTAEESVEFSLSKPDQDKHSHTNGGQEGHV